MDKTFYTIRTIAAKLGVSEKTIYRMLHDDRIPFALKIGGQWRFRADAIDGWLLARTNRPAGNRQTDRTISVHEGLQQGAILYRIHGRNRDECLDELLSSLPHSPTVNYQAVKVAILARESLASSSLNGVACMRPGQEAPFYVDRSIMVMAYLEKPTDFHALDGRKAEIILLTLPANLAEEAILSLRLHRLLMEPDFVAGIRRQMHRKELLQLVETTENRLMGMAKEKTLSRDHKIKPE